MHPRHLPAIRRPAVDDSKVGVTIGQRGECDAFLALISMATRQRPDIRDALKKVIDPEVGVRVVDLGLIREITVMLQGVEIRMVLASPACPLAGYLVEPVRHQVRSVTNGNSVEGLLEDKVWSRDDTAPHLLWAGRI